MIKIKSLKITFIYLSCITTSIAQIKHQDYSELVNTASKYYKEGNYINSLKAYQSAFEIKKDNATDFYNAACSAALSNKKDVAFNFLEISLSLGWNDSDHLEKDQDLYRLHPLPQWKRIVTKAQQNSKDLSMTGLLSKVESLIESRKIEDLLDMANIDSSLVDKSDFKNRIEFIYNFLNENKIKRLDELRKSSSNSSTIQGDVLKQIYQKSCNLIPKFFGKYTLELFTFPLGFDVQILLEKINGKWQLYNIELIDKTLESGYVLSEDIKEFLNKSDSVFFRFVISSGTKMIAGTGYIKVAKLEFLKNELNLVYQNSLETINNRDNSDNYMSLALIKNGPSYNLPFSNRFNDSKPPITKLEFIFSRSNMNICLISNGLGYGFYQIDLVSQVEKFVMSELYTIK